MEMPDQHELGWWLLVIFDGHCGLCNHSVRWFLARDRHDRMRFVPSDSPKVAALLERHGMTAASAPLGPESIVVVKDAGGTSEHVLVRSPAVLAMLSVLPRPWPAISAALGWIPKPILDLTYRLIARSRYRIWGRLDDICALPTPHQRRHFL
jgi:predicted DCC family thiol-disulfide oxidoreductase YuxK